MNKADDSLFLIVKQLSIKEIKCFSKTIFTSKTKQQLPKLFNAILTQEQYDEEFIKKKLITYIPTNSFPVVKSTLKSKLIDFLVANAPKSVFRQFNEMVIMIEVLVQKKLYREADELCDKLKKEAYFSANFVFCTIALYWKINLAQSILVNDFQKQYQQLQLERKNVIHQINYFEKLYETVNIAAQLLQKNNILRTNELIAFAQKLKKDELESIDFAISELPLKILLFLGLIDMAINLLLGEYEYAYYTQKILWNRLNENIEMSLRLLTWETPNSYTNFLATLLVTGRIAEGKEVIEKYYAQFGNPKVPSRENQAIEIYQLQFYLMEKAKKIVEEDIVSHENKLLTGYYDTVFEVKLGILKILSTVRYILKDYEKSNEYITELENIYIKNGIREDLYDFALLQKQINNFFILANQGFNPKAINSFEYTFTPWKRYINRKPQEEDYSFEQIFVNFFSKMNGKLDANRFQKVYDRFQKDYLDFEKKPNLCFKYYTSSNLAFASLIERIEEVVRKYVKRR